MAVYKCKMCGGELNVSPNETVVTCEFCGTKQTVASADDERKANLFNRANALRSNCEFDKALLSYQSILSLFPDEPEAHWGIVLCRYGIEYVDDPKTKKKKPTIHRSSFESILKDSDYLAAIDKADVVAREEYVSEAEEIASIQKGILAISQKEAPFDIFICYKESDDNGKRTPDSVIAQEIYDNLTEHAGGGLQGLCLLFRRNESLPFLIVVLRNPSHDSRLIIAPGKSGRSSVHQRIPGHLNWRRGLP